MDSSLVRDRFGRFQKGTSGNTDGRLPRQTETKYLDVTMGTVPVEKWAEVVMLALEDALSADNAHVRARAREWLAKYLIGEPSQLHQLLYKEEKNYNIVVTFGDIPKELPMGDIIDAEIIDEDSD